MEGRSKRSQQARHVLMISGCCVSIPNEAFRTLHCRLREPHGTSWNIMKVIRPTASCAYAGTSNVLHQEMVEDGDETQVTSRP